VDVHALAVEEAIDAETLFDIGEGVTLELARAIGDGLPEKSVGAVDESERGEDGGGVAEGDVETRSAAAMAGVVHAGEIIEEQRSSVEVLDGDGEIFARLVGLAVGGGDLKQDAWTSEAAGSVEGVQEGVTEMAFRASGERHGAGERNAEAIFGHRVEAGHRALSETLRFAWVAYRRCMDLVVLAMSEKVELLLGFRRGWLASVHAI
jgi:hypothetical protein